MQHHSHLFTVRVWREELGNSQSEWRGQVQLVVTGEIRYFRDWSTLITHLTTLLAASAPQGQSQDTPAGDEEIF